MLPVPLTQRFFFVCACPCRRFAIKRCSRCQLGISANELVMRARDQVFHLSCFACSACNRTLTPGEEFGLRDNLIYCRTDYELIFQGDYIPSLSPGMGHPGHSPNPNGSIPFYNGVGGVQKGRPRKRKSPLPDGDGCTNMGECFSIFFFSPACPPLIPTNSDTHISIGQLRK